VCFQFSGLWCSKQLHLQEGMHVFVCACTPPSLCVSFITNSKSRMDCAQHTKSFPSVETECPSFSGIALLTHQLMDCPGREFG
jgi:hypothetical protein